MVMQGFELQSTMQGGLGSYSGEFDCAGTDDVRKLGIGIVKKRGKPKFRISFFYFIFFFPG